MPEYLAPGVYVEETCNCSRSPSGSSTSGYRLCGELR
jgi:hypothetical protein